jgi:diguanylate cyclase (GGDEF)-like protein/PAS domain S-box-containing protein
MLGSTAGRRSATIASGLTRWRFGTGLAAWLAAIRRYPLVLTAIVVCLAAQALVILFQPDGSTVARVAIDLLVALGPACLLPFCLRGSRVIGRRPATLIGLSAACFVLGQVLFALSDLPGGPDPTLPSEWLFLAACPLALGGILALPADLLPSLVRARFALDGLLTLSALATGVWYVLLGPALEASGQPLSTRVLGGAYVGLALFLVAYVLVYVARPGTRLPQGVMGTLLLGCLTLIGTAFLYAHLLLEGRYQAGSWLDLGWPAGSMLLYFAVGLMRRADPVRGTGAAPGLPPPLWRALLPFSGVLLVGAVLLEVWRGNASNSHNLLLGTAVAGTATVGAFVARQVLSMLENRALPRQTAAAAARIGRLNEELSQARNQLQTVYEAIACGVIVWESPDRLLDANATALQHTGLSLEALRALPSPTWQYLKPDGEPLREDERPARIVWNTGRPCPSQVLRMHRPEAPERWLQVDAVPLFDVEGNVCRVVSTALDITERHQAEESLRSSEQSLQLLFTASPQPMWVYDLQTLRFLAVNEAAVIAYGYGPEEFLALTILDIRLPEDLARLHADLAETRSALQASGEWRHRQRDGEVFDVEIASHCLEFAGRAAVLVAAHDVSGRNQAYRALARERDFSAAVLDTVASLVVVFDCQSRVVRFNRLCEVVTGYPAAAVEGRVRWNLLDPPGEPARLRQRVAVMIDGTAGEDDRGILEQYWMTKSGARRLISWSARMLDDGAEGHTYVIATGIDITEQRAAEAAMARLSRQHGQILASAAEGIFGFDRSGYTTFANPAAARMLGYELDELVGQVHHSLIHHSHADGRPYPRAFCRLYAALGGGVHQVTDEVFWRKDGMALPVEYTSTPIWENGGISGAVVTFTDVTARKQAEAILAHQASHDSLTDLPNRAHLHERLRTWLAAAAASGSFVGLLLLDLDRFKEINDTLGHHTGDLLLRQVSMRLLETAPEAKLVARLGGDEFALILAGADAACAGEAAQRVLAALSRPFDIEEQSLAIGGSIGIALFPTHGETPEMLLRHADVAMYAAKRTHTGSAFYTATDDPYSADRLALVRDLRRMLDDDQLVLHYQPKVGRNGELLGVEALARWFHPTLGSVPPDVFIPLAEQTGMIEPLTRQVLAIAMAQSATWSAAGLHLPIAINLSTQSLHDQQFPAYLAALLESYGLQAGNIALEITEGSLMVDPLRALQTLTDLHDLGVRLSIDDFGTGYSSLGYLRDLPVDEVKVDKSFVRGMTARAEASAKDAAIVRSVIAMAHELSLEVVAEGVENRQLWDLLADMDCDIIQGYFVSRPLTARDLERWLDQDESLSQLLGHSVQASA